MTSNVKTCVNCIKNKKKKQVFTMTALSSKVKGNMRKKRLHFKENALSPYILEPGKHDFNTLANHWHTIFDNHHPIILEIGCGRGAYTLALAKQNPHKNFIGIDIKGDRLWYGAKETEIQNIKNVRFLRIRIEQIEKYFAKDEVSEIWITFPDPHSKRKSENKRLTGQMFLQRYHSILQSNGYIHLKTDSLSLFQYTKHIVGRNPNFIIKKAYKDISKHIHESILHDIQTQYEHKFRNEGRSITYLCIQKKQSPLKKYFLNLFAKRSA